MSEKRQKPRLRPKNPVLGAAIASRSEAINRALDEGDIDQGEWLFYCASRIKGAGSFVDLKAVGLRLLRMRTSRYLATGWELILNVNPASYDPDPDRNAYKKFRQKTVGAEYFHAHSPTGPVSTRGMALHVQRESGEKFHRRTAERLIAKRDNIKKYGTLSSGLAAHSRKDIGWGDPNGAPYTRAEFWLKAAHQFATDVRASSITA